ncbi:MAG: hypothetical protein AMXMBFR64_17870 [Myxococcales bacterium]
MDVGVREFKEHLSKYLERASRGEVIRVTDRGRPKAILGPVPSPSRLDQGVREGWVCSGSGEAPHPVQRVQARSPVLGALSEDRGA